MSWGRFNDQFRETVWERQERQRKARNKARAASVDTRPEGGDGTAPFTSGAVAKPDAKIPNDYNAQSPIPAPPDNQ